MNIAYLQQAAGVVDPANGSITWGAEEIGLTDEQRRMMIDRCAPHRPNYSVALDVARMKRGGMSIDGIVSAMSINGRPIKGFGRSSVAKYYPCV